MDVDTKNPPGGSYEHEGTTYYFCGAGCPGGVETIHWGQVGALDARGFNVGASDVCHSLGASMLEGACPGALKRTELRPGRLGFEEDPASYLSGEKTEEM